MECCNGYIINLGCYQSCDIVQIGINAPATGTYIIELVPEGKRIFSTDNTLGSPLIFSNGFGEDGISKFKILKPDGTYLAISGADCFQIENSIALVPALANVDITPIGCDPATVENSDQSFQEEIPSGDTLVLTDQTINVLIDSVIVATTTIPAMQDNTINIIWN